MILRPVEDATFSAMSCDCETRSAPETATEARAAQFSSSLLLSESDDDEDIPEDDGASAPARVLN